MPSYTSGKSEIGKAMPYIIHVNLKAKAPKIHNPTRGLAQRRLRLAFTETVC